MKRCVHLALGTLLLGCAQEPPRWIHLATEYEAVPLAEPLVVDAHTSVHQAEDPAALWIERTIEPGAWEPGKLPGTWKTTYSLDTYRRRVRLLHGEQRFQRATGAELRDPSNLPVDTFYLRKDQIHLHLDGEGPPPPAKLQVQIERGRREDGAWRTVVMDTVGACIPVLPGRRESLVLDLPPNSSLRFYVAGRLFERPPEDGTTRKARFLVSLDGEEIFSAEQPVLPRSRGTWHQVTLPKRARSAAKLEFALEGEAAFGAFFSPVVGPAEVGGYGQRPWDNARPNVVLFLADTFRADNLAFYGGDPGLAPRLNALAEKSVRFRRAWSPASWTLPAQGSMLSGLWPPEHGAELHQTAVAPELVTLAEHLARHGYRTGAITDAAYVSANFGFAQGFEWFIENKERNLIESLHQALEFLRADDGRPVFLFVQTYRTHSPYRIGAIEDGGPWRDLMRVIDFQHRASERKGEVERRELAFIDHADALFELYRKTVRALDVQVGPWVERLETLGLFDPGYLIVTSDHGEAFGEHGDMLHGGELWEEKTRVPLFVYSPELAPRSVDFAATLVDLPVTVARMARIQPFESWRGRSLLELDEDRTVFAFDRDKDPSGPRMTLIDGTRKVHAPDEPEAWGEGNFDRAFDLEQDPGEAHDLARENLPWPAEMVRRWAEFRAGLVPEVGPRGVELDPEEERRMKALGYGN